MGTSLRRMSRAEPASWLSARRCRLKDPRWTALRRRVRFTWDCRLILRGDRRGIHDVALDLAAITVFRDTASLQAARQVNSSLCGLTGCTARCVFEEIQ